MVLSQGRSLLGLVVVEVGRWWWEDKRHDVATKPMLFGHLSERAGRDGI